MTINDQTTQTRSQRRNYVGRLLCAVSRVIRSPACGRKIAVGRLTISPQWTKSKSFNVLV